MMHTGVMSVRSWDRRRGSLEQLGGGEEVQEVKKECSYRWG